MCTGFYFLIGLEITANRSQLHVDIRRRRATNCDILYCSCQSCIHVEMETENGTYYAIDVREI